MRPFEVVRFFALPYLCLAWLAIACCSHNTLAQNSPAGDFRTLDGFQIELVHDVTAADQGSWVALCVDPRDRILACDQYGRIYRVTLAGDGQATVEQLEINMGLAQGMLCAFDSLYININAKGRDLDGTAATGPGVYRLTDTTGDDQYDKVEYIVPVIGDVGEHGPHALVLSPDGQQIYFCSGNQGDVPQAATSGPVPRLWDEDHLLGRMPDARGHMAGRLAPGGWICRMHPDGSNIELVANGFRNEYDIAFNPLGDLFAYDADMEWDIGTPWYRPTRVNHVISGAEFGWRNGTGKWPEYYGDSFGAVVNIGPGSPTGIAFGSGAKFPAKYQRALFICDWSYGVMYAVHMDPAGATYRGQFESFVTAAPMAVTDVIIHPDGAMYFAVGGRRTASALYRLRYVGSESTLPAAIEDSPQAAQARQLRRQLESFHGRQDAAAVPLTLANLGNPDRAIRFSARIALEHQPLESWRSAALQLKDERALITAAYALSRLGSKRDQAALAERLAQIPFGKLPEEIKLELLRAHNLVWMRLGAPSEPQKQAVIAQLNEAFPSKSSKLNRELATTLVYLNAPGVVPRVVEQMRSAGAQDEQIHYAFCLRDVARGWTATARTAYFQWFYDVATARGGASFGGFLKNIRDAALANLSDQEKTALGELAGPMPEERDPLEDLTPRDVVAQWDVAGLQAELARIAHKPNFQRGQMLTATAQCFKCHRFAGQGGIQGPDLTATSGRFNDLDMLTAIVEPNKEISDQYQATQFLTEDGQVVTGRVANLNGDTIQIVTNMLDPGLFTQINASEISERRPSPLSMMPAGLLDTFTVEEIAEILAYLRSGGNADHDVYAE